MPSFGADPLLGWQVSKLKEKRSLSRSFDTALKSGSDVQASMGSVSTASRNQHSDLDISCSQTQ